MTAALGIGYFDLRRMEGEWRRGERDRGRDL